MCRTLYAKAGGEPPRVLLLHQCHNHLADIPLRGSCVLKWKTSQAWKTLELLPGTMIFVKSFMFRPLSWILRLTLQLNYQPCEINNFGGAIAQRG